MTRTMWDGVNSDARAIAGLAKPGDLVAYYIDGYFAWTKSEIALFPSQQHVTITVLGNSADVADCETGDMTPESAANWVRKQKAGGYNRPTIYRSLSMMDDVRKTTGNLVMGKDWDGWVADYDNRTDVVYGGAAAKQYKSTNSFDESVVYDDQWPHRTITRTTPITPIVTNAPKWPAGQILVKSNKGNAVLALQKALRDSGIHGVRGIGVDGIFGDQTLTAVRNFQEACKLGVDGVAGAQTRARLISRGLMNAAGQAA